MKIDKYSYLRHGLAVSREALASAQKGLVSSRCTALNGPLLAIELTPAEGGPRILATATDGTKGFVHFDLINPDLSGVSLFGSKSAAEIVCKIAAEIEATPDAWPAGAEVRFTHRRDLSLRKIAAAETSIAKWESRLEEAGEPLSVPGELGAVEQALA